jgi:hypothetical protein
MTLHRLILASELLLLLWVSGLFVILVYHIMRTTIRGKKAERCANCGKSDVRPSWPAGIVDRLLAGCHHYPYRCRACYYRYYRCRRTPPTVIT